MNPWSIRWADVSPRRQETVIGDLQRRGRAAVASARRAMRAKRQPIETRRTKARAHLISALSVLAVIHRLNYVDAELAREIDRAALEAKVGELAP